MTEQPDKRPLGQIAFDAYNAERGGLTHDGKPTPPWEVLGDGVRSGWTAGAHAVLKSATFPDRSIGGRDACPDRHASTVEDDAWAARVRKFWMPIIAPHGVIEENLVLAELSTYSHIMNEVPVVYSAITGDRLSKPNYFATGVISIYEDLVTEDTNAAVLEALCIAGDLADGNPEVLEVLRTAAEVMGAGDFTAEFTEYRERMAQGRAAAPQAQLGAEGSAP